ncbi:MAG TPA: hypothetical protein VE643_08600 [Nitrososphaeraceae archaeon]|nr:hypothetical protein [Nitrososphaeraceae archaeon]
MEQAFKKRVVIVLYEKAFAIHYNNKSVYNIFRKYQYVKLALANGKEHDNENNDIKDDIIRDYDSIIRESALLTTVSGFLFGFLLNISLNTPKGFGPLDSIVLMISLFAITLAVSLFAMPVVYHHLQYPYRDLQKFKLRSHRFIKFGIVPAAITLYLGLDLGLDLGLKLGFPSMNFDYLGFIIAGIPFAFIYILFRERK